ncbi:MAG: L-2-hydroxyglutarate oxidase [Actinomycetota bacterium]|nr:L-2-hydroxyglutarate oxidase [Actinomycetota bacterium]
MSAADVVVIGGGIVGLATARAITTNHPERSLVLLDKEDHLAAHQTGRNSGVIHSGIYYKPGSMKARTCTTGREALVEFCEQHRVAFETCGKVIVATREAELTQLDVLAERARANGVPCERIDRARLRELEPHGEGLAALHVPVTGIVDFVGMCEAIATDLRDKGAEIRLSSKVIDIDERDDGIRVSTTSGDIEAGTIVNCAGLFSDRVAQMAGADDGTRIMPFRGEYYELVPERRNLVKNLIYPVPDPRFPFLGVHYTRMINGEVHAGPNAVPAMAREGYNWRTIDRQDLLEVAKAPATRTLARKYWKTEAGEIVRSMSKQAFVRALRVLVPEINGEDLVRGEAGVRAQAISPEGDLLDDFAISETTRSVHVLNAPSPAATASLEIGRLVAEKLGPHLH